MGGAETRVALSCRCTARDSSGAVFCYKEARCARSAAVSRAVGNRCLALVRCDEALRQQQGVGPEVPAYSVHEGSVACLCGSAVIGSANVY